MRRFSVVIAAMSLTAVAACTRAQGGGSSAVAQRVGPVNVHVFCDDATGPGIGARVNPWRVHTKGAPQVTFNINATPGTTSVTAVLDSVPGKPWAFQAPSYPPSNGTITAQIATAKMPSSRPDTTYYRLTLMCPTDTIVIDPQVIID